MMEKFILLFMFNFLCLVQKQSFRTAKVFITNDSFETVSSENVEAETSFLNLKNEATQTETEIHRSRRSRSFESCSCFPWLVDCLKPTPSEEYKARNRLRYSQVVSNRLRSEDEFFTPDEFANLQNFGGPKHFEGLSNSERRKERPSSSPFGTPVEFDNIDGSLIEFRSQLDLQGESEIEN